MLLGYNFARTYVGTYSFVNWTIKSLNQLPAGLLASFPYKLNMFRKRVKNVVTSQRIEVGIECKWVKCCEVYWCGVKWRDLCEVILFWSEVKWVTLKFLGTKVNMHSRVTLCWGYWVLVWLFYLMCILYCGCFNSFCNVCLFVCVCVCVCVGVL